MGERWDGLKGRKRGRDGAVQPEACQRDFTTFLRILSVVANRCTWGCVLTYSNILVIIVLLTVFFLKLKYYFSSLLCPGCNSLFLSSLPQGGLVVEDMYIPKRTAQWLYKGYKIIKSTVEGGELTVFFFVCVCVCLLLLLLLFVCLLAWLWECSYHYLWNMLG